MNEGDASRTLSPSCNIETGKEPCVADIAPRVAGKARGHAGRPCRGDEFPHRGANHELHRCVLDKGPSAEFFPRRVGMQDRSRIHGAGLDADETAAAGEAKEQHEIGIVFCE